MTRPLLLIGGAILGSDDNVQVLTKTIWCLLHVAVTASLRLSAIQMRILELAGAVDLGRMGNWWVEPSRTQL